MEIFKLFGRVLVDNDKADKSISATEKKGQNLGQTLQNAGKFALKAGAVMGTAFVAAGSAALALAKKTGDAADRLLDLNSITGMSTDEIQKWERVTKVAGVNTDAMTNASQKLTKSLDTIIESGGKGAESLSALGLSVSEISAMSADERMNAIATALSEVGDKTERAKLGTDLLGGSWKEIAPIVDLGAESMQKAKDSANIISNDDLVKANDFRIKMAEMGDKITYVGMTLGVKLLPLADKLFAWVEKAMPSIEKAIDVSFKVITIAIETVIVWIEKLIDWGKKWFKENEDTVNGIKEGFMLFFEAVKNFFEGFILVVSDLWERYGENITEIIKIAFGLIKDIIVIAFKIITDVFNIFGALFKGDWDKLWESVKSLFSNIFDLIGKIFDAGIGYITEGLKIWGKVFSDIWNGIWGGIVSGTKGFINLIIDNINGMIQSVVNGVNKLSDVVSNVPGIDIKKLNAPKIPRLEVGTNYVEREGLAYLHEGEAVVPKKYNPNAGGAGSGFVVNITGNTIMNDRDVDRFGQMLVKRLRVLGVNANG